MPTNAWEKMKALSRSRIQQWALNSYSCWDKKLTDQWTPQNSSPRSTASTMKNYRTSTIPINNKRRLPKTGAKTWLWVTRSTTKMASDSAHRRSIETISTVRQTTLSIIKRTERLKSCVKMTATPTLVRSRASSWSRSKNASRTWNTRNRNRSPSLLRRSAPLT